MDYQEFLHSKTHSDNEYGFEPDSIPSMLYDFQKSLVQWSVRKGRAAIFADCGLGKTFIQLVWADNVARHTSKRVLILTPLSVSPQTVSEGEKIGIQVSHRREGVNQSDNIVVTNYERLHYFKPEDFAGVVCDESSILKNFDGKTKAEVTAFMRHIPYRLLCTATAAPNDYIELGTSSEALGELGYIDMLKMFFKAIDNNYSQGCGQRTGQRRFEHQVFGGKFRFRGHAEKDFWRWVCSWARAMRKPSDLGFQDGPFNLKPLVQNNHTVKARTIDNEWLFEVPAFGLFEQRKEVKRTIQERCEMAAELVAHTGKPFVIWCHLNDEGNLLEKLIPDAAQVSGADSDEAKEEAYEAFALGQSRGLIGKQRIAGWGLNWQHCAHVLEFASHSYEQHYQGVRRCWRFGQKHPVINDLIVTEGERGIKDNMRRKSDAADRMFTMLVRHMHEAMQIDAGYKFEKQTEVPTWL